MLNFKNIFFGLFYWVLIEGRTMIFLALALSKSVYAYAEHTHAHHFTQKRLSIWGQIKMCWLKNKHFEPPQNISLNGEKKLVFKNLMLRHL